MKRTLGKKIAFGFAAASFISMAASLALFIYFTIKGYGGLVTSSVFATTLFFLSCGVVLYFMSKPPRYALQPWDGK